MTGQGRTNHVLPMYMGVIPVNSFVEAVNLRAPHVYGGDPCT